MPAMTWNYAYSIAFGSFAPCNGCVNTKTVTVTDPLNNVIVNTYGTQFGVDEGLLLSSSEGASGSAALRLTNYAYAAAGAGPYTSSVGIVNQPADWIGRVYRPQNQRTIAQQGVNFTQQVTAFDVYARATAVTRSSSLGYSKAESTAYHDNTSLWVLGQVAARAVNGIQTSSTTYDLSTALPGASYSFGKPQATYAFNADGTMRSVTDGLNHATVFSSFMRGLPQRIDYADGRFQTASVNNIGAITGVTNEAGTTWNFGYDAMGRLASKTAPGGDPVAYHTTTLAFAQISTAEVGLEPNHWRQTITTGNAVTVNYFDARWRKRVTLAYDAASPGTTQRMQRFDYDPYNRTTFAAYPARSIASIGTAVPGTTTVYDALGRPVQTRADSELGVLTTITSYLAGFQKRVTNPRGYFTTSAYQVFDEPSEDAIAAVWAPESSTLSIVRDVFGKPTSITRSGSYGGGSVSATRAYVYDGFQQLCKTIEPESGASVQFHDAANNVAWRASGLSLPSTASCDHAGVPAARQITYGYDARNRLTSTTYGDGSPGIGRNYTADGLLNQIWSAGSTWTYGYNNRRLRTNETLNFNGANYGIGWGFDAYGNVASLSYPDGAVVAYSPDALGRPTQVSGFAAGIWHHPNGLVGGYALANGIAHSSTQKLRGLPETWRDAGVVQDFYSYDANANVTGIADQQEGVSSRSMGYDGLDRLTAANGVWGAGSFGYDALDNLRASTVGARSASMAIDGTNRLSSLTVNGLVQGFGYDANGNLTNRGGQGFYFDIGNRLQSAAGKASYSYDGHGRRAWVAYADGSWKLQVYGEAGKLLWSQHSSQGATRHVYLGDRLIAEVTSAGPSYSHTDALGSPVARTNDSGQVTSRTRYEPYGATAAGTNPTGIGFTGHVNDADTSLVYMQQRYYEPLAGRFLSVDQVTTDHGTGDHFNRYVYAENNPFKFKDPDGRLANFAIGFVIGAGIEAAVQVWQSGGSITNGAAVLGAGVSGSLTGGVGGVLSRAAASGATSAVTATAKTAAAGGAAAVVGKHVEGAVSGTTPTGKEIAVAAAAGALGAGIGGQLTNGAMGALEAQAAKAGVQGHVGTTTINAVQQGGKAAVSTSVGTELTKVGVDLSAVINEKAMSK
jgi:RHS repeat-associated protein